MMVVCISESWDKVLDNSILEETKKNINLIKEKRKEFLEILPSDEDIFNALKYTNFENVKVLIIGQDPYPNKEDAHGLAFSKKTGELPVSLKNIFKEIEEDTGIKNTYGNLQNWADEGILLLNRSLTIMKDGVKKNESKLLKYNLKIWESLINEIITKLINRNKPLVIMLWGGPANNLFQREKDNELLNKKVCILRASHPSPLGCRQTLYDGEVNSFIGCKHFSKCNEFLKKNSTKPIDWNTCKVL